MTFWCHLSSVSVSLEHHPSMASCWVCMKWSYCRAIMSSFSEQFSIGCVWLLLPYQSQATYFERLFLRLRCLLSVSLKTPGTPLKFYAVCEAFSGEILQNVRNLMIGYTEGSLLIQSIVSSILLSYLGIPVFGNVKEDK